MSAEAEAPSEDVVSKYKRLLTLARSSLEANQTSIAAKDKYITQLQKALEDEKAQRHNKIGRGGGKDEESLLPRNILRRVDVDDIIWILVEYDSNEDSWVSFGSNQELSDYIQRIPGIPLVVPPKCYTAAESTRIESESKKRVERVVEEFRRFKVRTEITRKSKDAEGKLSVQRNNMSMLNSSSPQSLQSEVQDPSNPGESQSSEFQRLRLQLSEQETKWRKAYESIVKENELLRTRGGEAILALQWRERYESCLRERDMLSEKLQLVSAGSGQGERTGSSPGLSESEGGNNVRWGEGGREDGKPLDQAYEELKEEYKEFRHRVRVAEEKRQSARTKASTYSTNRGSDSSYSNSDTTNGSNEYGGNQELNSDIYSNNDGSMGGGAGGGGMRSLGLGESKIQYVRHMVFQYLTCKDAIVKPHIESALIALFRYNDLERIAIDDKRKSDTEDTITSISNYLGLFTSS